MFARRPPAAFSLIEMLIVIAVLGVVTAVVLPTLTPAVPERLEAVAQVVCQDLSYGRSLAVANNSRYRFQFNPTGDSYYLEHSGTNSTLTNLPDSPFRSPGARLDRYEVQFDRLPHAGGYKVHLHSVTAGSSPPASVSTLEFGPLGSTTASTTTTVWLRAGIGNDTRYLPITVHPITGLCDVGDLQSTAPSVSGS